ncbi:hypothetical protein [Zymomonas mobilis]|uniref:Uncharacterized protein n=3 Tax=Zymomonas mobilis TaxID=542 RepID=A0A0H3G0L0_ZYMMA|nr:hypothetical protein [Zymomonas mobilis]AEH63566.1 conserved hypothetical protein [Zymomonas mobilis subsp. mobilis ATCC 10988]TQL26720.1 hypothetical protein FBY54_1839 [Zymomonas mobilis]
MHVMKKSDQIDYIRNWVRQERLLRDWSTRVLAEKATQVAKANNVQIDLKQQSISYLELGHMKSVPSWLQFVEQAFEENPPKLLGKVYQKPQTFDCNGKTFLPDESSLKKILIGLLAPMEDHIPWDSKYRIASSLAKNLPKGIKEVGMFLS